MARQPLIAVVGHVEWARFLAVERFPAEGEIVHARAAFAQAAGGGGVVARALAWLGAEVHFFCALGRDRIGVSAQRELAAAGVHLHVALRDQPTRRAVTLIGPGRERTIVTVGKRLEPSGGDPLPWELCARAQALYLTAADASAHALARRCPLLVASPRTGEALAVWQGGEPAADLLIYSGGDGGEREAAGAACQAGWRPLRDAWRRRRPLVPRRGAQPPCPANRQLAGGGSARPASGHLRRRRCLCRRRHLRPCPWRGPAQRDPTRRGGCRRRPLRFRCGLLAAPQPTGWPLAVSLTSMLPRVAFE